MIVGRKCRPVRRNGLLQFGPERGFPIGVDLHMDDVRPATNRAVFHVLLFIALRDIDRYDDFFAARAADIRRFITHGVWHFRIAERKFFRHRRKELCEPSSPAIGPGYMTGSPQTRRKARSAAEVTLAKALAPEEIRTGDFVTPLYVVAQAPSYWWCAESWNLPLEEPIRIRFVPATDGMPMKVCSVCVPFVLVKTATGERKMLDLRTYQLARLSRPHAKRAWKELKKAAARPSRTASVADS